jgi:hypothetical protein
MGNRLVSCAANQTCLTSNERDRIMRHVFTVERDMRRRKAPPDARRKVGRPADDDDGEEQARCMTEADIRATDELLDLLKETSSRWGEARK